MSKVIATATFRDAYGESAVVLRSVGRDGRANWQGVETCVACGYRNAPAKRLISAAENDRRFSDVVVVGG